MRQLSTTLAQNLGGGSPSFFVRAESNGSLVIDGLSIPNLTPNLLVNFLAVAVDETDTGWWGSASVGTDNPTTIPITFTNNSRYGQAIKSISGGGGTFSKTPIITIKGDGAGGQAIAIMNGNTIDHFQMICGGFGYTFADVVINNGVGGGSGTAEFGPLGVGDYFVWNDVYNYELCQIVGIGMGGAYIIARGLFGSTIVAHNCALFRLVSSSLSRPAGVSSGAQRWKFVFDSMCVCAVVGSVGNNPAETILLTPASSDSINKPRPGLRTMSGAAYTSLGISGNCSIGATAQARVSVQDWETIRTVYAKVKNAPTGADLIINVVYIASDGVSAGLIDQITISAGSYCSYTVLRPPIRQQMPYHTNWSTSSPYQLDWPPNKLTSLTTPLDSNGNLQLPITQDPSSFVMFAPDGSLRGSIDFIIQQIGTTFPGAGLIVTVQT